MDNENTHQLSINDAAKLIARVSEIYADRFKIKRDEIWYLLKLQEEIGELTKAYINHKGLGKKVPENAKAELEAEIADVLAHILLLADKIGIDSQKALQNKWLSHLK